LDEEPGEPRLSDDGEEEDPYLLDSLFTLHSGSYLLSQTIIEKSSTVDPLPFTARGGIEDQGLVAVRT